MKLNNELKETLVQVFLNKNGKKVCSKEFEFHGVFFEEYFAYDERNNLIHISNTDGCAFNMKYDENNNMIESVDFTGLIVKYNYDENNNMILSTDLYGNSTKQFFDNNKLIRSIENTVIYGEKTTIFYDENGYMIERCNGNIIHRKFNENHDIIYKKVSEVGSIRSKSGLIIDVQYVYEEFTEYDQDNNKILFKRIDISPDRKHYYDIIKKYTYREATEEELVIFENKCKENDVS